MSPGVLVARYVIFAVIATVSNLAVQRLVLSFGREQAFYLVALLAGTGIGLVVKYFLDSKWIFYQFDKNVAKNARIFVLYTSTGIVTTAIFWGTETAFWMLSASDSMRELGAIVGLSIGYVTKYLLDRRYVFNVVPASRGVHGET